MQKAFRFDGVQRIELAPVYNSPTVTWSPQLIFPPGYFRYNDVTYDISASGLYKFYSSGVNTTHMIVVDGGDVATTLLSAASWLTAFGDADAGLSDAQLSARARTSVLRLLCGRTHDWVKSALLDPAGVTSRPVYFLAMDEPNYSVDGHQALEVYTASGQVLVDVSTKVLFRNASGARLSAVDAVTEIAAGDSWSHEALAEPFFSIEPAGGFDATGYAMTHLLTEADRRAWHRRLFQAVGLAHDGKIWFRLPAGAENRKNYVLSLSANYRVVDDHAAWLSMFY